MDVRRLLEAIESVAPLQYQESWDRGGVQVAGRTADIRRLALMLDPRPDMLDQALAWGADFVLCHHPLTLSPRLPDRLDGLHHVLRSLLRRDAWLYSAHTSLDVQPQGPAGWLAREFGLLTPRVVEPIKAEGLGFGQVGDLPRPLPLAEFQAALAAATGRQGWLAAGKAPETVRRMAYCPGSGGALAQAAFAMGADVYVTGEVRHHQAVEAATAGGLVLDVGHFCLEERMMRAFHERLAVDLAPQEVETAFFAAAEPLRMTNAAGDLPGVKE